MTFRELIPRTRPQIIVAGITLCLICLVLWLTRRGWLWAMEHWRLSLLFLLVVVGRIAQLARAQKEKERKDSAEKET